jgi:hypothetical protein
VAPAPSSSSCRPTAPDLNPIEQLFAKLKTLLRKAARRTVEPPGNKSEPSSAPSRRKNAPTTSETPDTLQNERIRLPGGAGWMESLLASSIASSSPQPSTTWIAAIAVAVCASESPVALELSDNQKLERLIGRHDTAN